MPRMLARSRTCLLFLSLLFCAVPIGSEAEEDSDSGYHDLDAVDTGRTHSLDSVDKGRTHDLDRVEQGRTDTVDAVEKRDSEVQAAAMAAPAAPPALPPIADGDWEAQLANAKRIVDAAETRLRAANAAYGNMMARQYPGGDARLAIIEERQVSERWVADAWEYYGRVKQAAGASGHPVP